MATAVMVTGALAISACGNSPGRAPTAEGPVGSAGTPATASDGSQVPVDAPGVTASEIRVGGVTSATNPLGGRYGEATNGVQAYFDMVNAAGGVHGRKLVLAAQRDDKLANNSSEVQGLLTQDDVFAVLPVATLLFTGADQLVQANVPTFGWNINAEWSGTAADPKANMFGQAGSYLCFTCAAPVTPWVAQQAGATKVGLLAYSVAQSSDCADGVAASFDRYGSATGASVAYVDKSLAYGTADLSVQVSKMKDAGVDFVFTCIDTNGVVTLAKEMKKQGLDAPQYLPDGYDQQFLAEFGDLFEGSFVRTDFVQFEIDDKPQGLRNYLDWIAKAGAEPSANSMVGWLNADLFYRGLQAAGPNFSRQNVIDAINEMTDYTADGLLAGVNWTTAHTGDPSADTFCQFISKIEASAFTTAFSEPGRPFVCVVVNGDSIETTYE